MDHEKKIIRVLFILDCLEGGGAQRTVLNILRCLNRDKFEIRLVLIKKKGDFLKFLPSDIKVYDLNCRAARYCLFKIVRVIKKEKPHLIFSTLTYINELTYLAVKFFKNPPPVIMRSANIESINLQSESFLTKKLIRKAYRSANKVVVLTEAMKKDFIENFGIKEGNIVIIPNMVDIDQIKRMSEELVSEQIFLNKPSMPTIVSVGRLTRQKGFEFLIRAFGKYRKRKKAKLAIIGRGDLSEELVGIVKELKVENDVFFIGFKDNPYKYIARSDIFVLPSIWEGFPNALIEAMACGVPVISSDCPSGPSEIIVSGLNGIIVPLGDIDALCDAVGKILEDKKLRSKLIDNGKERAKEYDVKRVILMHEHVMLDVVKGHLKFSLQ